MKRAFTLDSTGEEIEVSPNNGKDFSLEELQKLISSSDEKAYIEIVSLPNSTKIMIADEDGIRKELRFNPFASQLYKGIIFGKVLVCECDMVK